MSTVMPDHFGNLTMQRWSKAFLDIFCLNHLVDNVPKV